MSSREHAYVSTRSWYGLERLKREPLLLRFKQARSRQAAPPDKPAGHLARPCPPRIASPSLWVTVQERLTVDMGLIADLDGSRIGDVRPDTEMCPATGGVCKLQIDMVSVDPRKSLQHFVLWR